MKRHQLCGWLGLVLCLVSGTTRAEDIIDSPMYRLPEIPAAPLVLVLDAPKELWLRALERPEQELRAEAADTLVQAQQQGIKGLDSVIPQLLAALDKGESSSTVRLAVARALVALDARDSAARLLALARSGNSDFQELIDPALARWDHRPARSMWLERLKGPEKRLGGRVLAIRSLATVRETEASELLRSLCLSRRNPDPLRLEAARGLARLRGSGLEADAASLLTRSDAEGIADRLVSVSLLQEHQGRETISLLQRLARDAEPAVATLAVARLLALDASTVPEPESLLTHADARLRLQAVEVLRRHPSAPRIARLRQQLGDENPEVRQAARRALFGLASMPELRQEILRAGMFAVEHNRWESQEQAAILLTQLDHKPAAERLVPLLAASRPEVFVTAAWGLRKLAVASTLPAVIQHVRRQQQSQRASADAPGPNYVYVDHQLSQLNQLLGQMRHTPADQVLRDFVPRMAKGMSPESRAAAIWALGMVHEKKTIPELIPLLEARLNDEPPEIPSESLQVRWMAAVALARMQANSTLPSLRKHYRDEKPSLDVVNNACGWAIEQLTGERVPAPVAIRRPVRGAWFLQGQSENKP